MEERAVKLARIDKNTVLRRINELPDELIMKIFSTVLPFKASVATRLLSKWCEDPWKLDDDPDDDVTIEDDDEKSLMSFYGSLFSNDAPVILETMRLKLIQNHSASDIKFWVKTAVKRSVRKLRFDLFGRTLELPDCLSTCTTLKSLILRDVTISVVPYYFQLPSLKSLHLFSVEFSNHHSVASLLHYNTGLEYLVLNETKYDGWLRLPSLKSLHLCSVTLSAHNSITRLLKSCPVLESLVINQTKSDYVMFEAIPPRSCLSSLRSLHLLSVTFVRDEHVTMLLKNCASLQDLVIRRTKDDNVGLFYIDVPTLKSLTINNGIWKRDHDHGFAIRAPALEKLSFKDTFSNFLKFGYMPEVTTANIEVRYDQSEKFIGSLIFIRHLSLCCPASETPYPWGTLFFFLEHLELCTRSAKLLASILNDAPSLQSIKLKSQCSSARYKRPLELRVEPTVVPGCLLKRLEILEWREYEGTEQERQVAAYILGNAICLKMATFSTRCRDKYTELQKMSRVSEICQLMFEEALV
ncbi:hypothetical protein Bca4012_061317 [Brassica carinata]